MRQTEVNEISPQAYSQVYARVYNKHWTHFAHRVAPRIEDFYAGTAIGQANRSVLDLCCGTGQLALYFLGQGYRVTGVDLSAPMLQYARENASGYVEEGQARFVQADASDFSLDETFGLVVSTFDALNHLDSQEALLGCFRSVFPLLVPGGYFVFDLNTRDGLRRWNNIHVVDGEEAMIVTRGIYDGQSNRAWTQVSGFLRTPKGLYERFEETVYNTVFDLAWVRQMLLEIGWQEVHCARIEELDQPIEEPEREVRTFFVARK
jgi:SAM-dependent methyltransferase